MRYLFFILIFGFTGVLTYAQESDKYFGNEGIFIEPDTTNSIASSPLLDTKRLGVRFSAGTMFSSSYGGMFSSYAAPEINYRLNNKFSFSVGTMMTSSSIPSFVSNDATTNSFMDNKMISYYMFARGEYMVNDKLRVRSTAAFDVSPMNKSNTSLAFGSFGFDYKIGENAFISAEFVINNGRYYNPTYGNMPFDNGFGNNRIRPFGNSLFSDPYSRW
ncbi:MAG: hypothetical protein PHW82_00660 [Bacteroidales bacterium]|nr:hypothetical protein [Bacteroidales bacterium]